MAKMDKAKQEYIAALKTERQNALAQQQNQMSALSVECESALSQQLAGFNDTLSQKEAAHLTAQD